MTWLDFISNLEGFADSALASALSPSLSSSTGSPSDFVDLLPCTKHNYQRFSHNAMYIWNYCCVSVTEHNFILIIISCYKFMICANDQKRKYSIIAVSCHFAFVDNIRHPFNQTFMAFNILIGKWCLILGPTVKIWFSTLTIETFEERLSFIKKKLK